MYNSIVKIPYTHVNEITQWKAFIYSNGETVCETLTVMYFYGRMDIYETTWRDHSFM